MDEETYALRNNDTWDLVPFLDGWKLIENKQMFKRSVKIEMLQITRKN